MTLFLLSILLGVLLGLLAGVGSLLAVPVFRFGLGEEAAVAFPGALLVVAIANGVRFFLGPREGLREHWKAPLLFALVSLPSAFLGGRLSPQVPDGLHMGLFGALVLFVAWRLVKTRGRTERLADRPDWDPGRLFLSAGATGFVTGLLGIGGGVFVVPILVFFARMPFREAVPAGTLVVCLNALSGLGGHLGSHDLPWGRLSQIGALVAVGAYFGTRLATRFPARRMRQGFGFVIVALAVWIFVREARG